MRLTGQTLLVVGGTSGIGLATVRTAMAEGARVVLTGRNSDKLKAALAALGTSAQGELADAADREAMLAVYARTGKIDHLVLAASGRFGAGSFATLPREQLEQGFDAKFWVQWQCAQTALPFMAERGSITFVTAVSARVGNPGTSGLAAINGAIGAMVLPLAHELGPLRVNAVSPGVIDTPWWERQPAAMRREVFERVATTLPARRVGQADDVADAIIFLAGNSYVTGIILDVDGGMRASAL